MCLRSVIRGLSVMGLPPAKLTMFADDINLFLSIGGPSPDNIPLVLATLSDVTFTIGSLFNNDKTEVKPVGSPRFKVECCDPNSPNHSLIPAAKVLNSETPIRILGVWVGSPDRAHHRWTQISRHINKIIQQWNGILVSVRNHVLIAKALLLSRCYYLLDGNSIPPRMLTFISQRIMRFVRGRNSYMPYAFLEAPKQEGGLNCPSLTSRYHAFNLKFLSDLISRDPHILWKTWTLADLRAASYSSAAGIRPHLNPLAQHTHTFVSRLEPRLRAAYKSARLLGIDIDTCFPSPAAKLNAPAMYHPAIPVKRFNRAKCPHTRTKDFHSAR